MTVPLTRALGAAQLALGLVLVSRPERVAPSAPSWLVRILGARGLVQGALTVAVPDPAVLALGASVDTAHALSMVPVAIGSSRYRRPAAVSAGVAAALAAAAAALARADAATARRA
ncbi:MAG TPA: hypothetical protein VIG48_01550 [Jatrophihabitans sp.]|jgi:hypothetical protein